MRINHPSTVDGWNPHPRGVPTKVLASVAPAIVCFVGDESREKAQMGARLAHAPLRACGSENGGGNPLFLHL